jgi:hypothetical protein
MLAMPASSSTPRRGKVALQQLYRGITQGGHPLVFLDFDDVICLNDPYGGHDVFQPEDQRPVDLWQRLFHPPAVQVLQTVVAEFEAQLVITTSWLRLMERDGFEALFRNTGLESLARALHASWEAPSRPGDSRWRAIERWLHAHYEGQPLVVLDDTYSGTGLAESPLHQAGRVVLCETRVGLCDAHLPHIRRALSG